MMIQIQMFMSEKATNKFLSSLQEENVVDVRVLNIGKSYPSETFEYTVIYKESRTEHGCEFWQKCNHGETCPSETMECPDRVKPVGTTIERTGETFRIEHDGDLYQIIGKDSYAYEIIDILLKKLGK